MSLRHVFGYSPQVPAKCSAPGCPNPNFPPNTLRYGQAVKPENSHRETVTWRHWGCVTPLILQQLAHNPLETFSGYKKLSAADQQKISRAVVDQRINPVDIISRNGVSATTSSRVPSVSPNRLASASLKRKDPPASGYTPGRSQDNEDLDVADNEPDALEELYCQMNTQIVGVQYYSGLVAAGEQVSLNREYNNAYDKNAIQVKNIHKAQVGHVPRAVAAKLAPLMDQGLVTVEGVMGQGNVSTRKKVYTLEMILKIYAPSDRRATIEPLLIWATPGQRGFPKSAPVASTSTAGAQRYSASIPSQSSQPPIQQVHNAQALQESLRKAAQTRELLQNLEKVNDESRRTSLMDSLCSVDDVLELPEHPDPPGKANKQLRVDLLKHQKQALQWCINREHPILPTRDTDKPVQFWQMRSVGSGRSYYYNVVTNTPVSERPVLAKGALCADAMGLGKTLTMISLVLATKTEQDTGFSGATLIVVPLSVLSNWQTQIKDHCQRGALSYNVHYGSDKHTTAEQLQKYDVVITTYHGVLGEYPDAEHSVKKKKVSRPLFRVKWKRIILDEGHTIRNPKTKVARACCALEASRRWVLTGTPIINSPQDLGSILSFLRICQPLDKEEFFKRLILRPLRCGDSHGAELLRRLMVEISLRRTKEMKDSGGNPLVPLPPVEMIRIPVTMTKEARDLYNKVEELSGQRISQLIKMGTASVQSNALSLLLRLRQIALHPGLVPANYVEQLEKANAAGDLLQSTQSETLTPEKKIELQARLAHAIEECVECPVCFEAVMTDPPPRITPCGHVYCFECIKEVITRDARCPYDRLPLTLADLLEPPPPKLLTQKPPSLDEEYITWESSAKIDQLITLLRVMPAGDKSLVFSQFTGFLDKIGKALDDANIPFVRFDGQMSANKREEAIARFNVPLDPNTRNEDAMDSDSEYDDDLSAKGQRRSPRVMLISLKAGALGLNLTIANHVYLMDPWWQESIESQAVDRVNRIGQKKDVKIYQLISEDTVESKVLDIQDRKKALIEQAFSGMKHAESRRQPREAKLQELLAIFKMPKEPDNEGSLE